ncbi:hypothetical protein BDY24DRAFT_344949, partial [Mrakia frigida]|uniref:uncharacterized protein n=1 Tax=Mrakia frigida TaxID=29902 RepID=UPI003FCC03C1
EAYVEKRYPLVIFSKSFCPYSRKAKSIISFLNPSPAPLIIEVDLRPDARPLKSLLTHLTSRSTFPNILLGFVPLGGGDEIELLFAEGGLGKKFKNAGLRVNA